MGTRSIEGEQGPDDWQYVQGFEPPPGFRLPVDLPEPITVRQLPAASGQVHTVRAPNLAQPGPGAATKLLNENEQRGRTIVMADSDFYFGYDKATVESGDGHVPAGQQLTITNSSEIWVCGGAAATYVTAIVDYWTR